MSGGKTTNKIETEVKVKDGFTPTMNALAKGLNRNKKMFQGFATAGRIAIGAGAALGGALALSTLQAAKFEKGMSEVKAISGASGREFQLLSDKAREMGAKTSYSATEAAEGLKYMALAGWETSEILEGIEPILHLAEAGALDLGRASDLVTDSMAGLGYEAKDMTKYLDAVAQTARSSNTDIDALMEAFIISGGVFKQYNVPLEESTALLGVLANRGYKGAEAGRAMNAITTNLTTGFGRAGKAMEEINVSAYDSQGNFKGLEAVFREVIEATADMTEEERNRIFSMLAGKEHTKTFMAIINGLGEEYDELKGKTINSTGALEEMRTEMKDNVLGVAERVKSAFGEMAISLGEVLLPALRSTLEGIEGLINGFNGLSKEQKEGIVMAAAVVSGYLVFIGTVWLVVGVVGTLVVTMGPLLGIFAKLALGSAALGSAFGILAKNGIGGLQKQMDKAVDSTVEFGDSVSDTTSEAVSSFMEMSRGVDQAFNFVIWGSRKVSKELKSEMQESQAELHDNLMSNIDNRHKAELSRAEEHLSALKDLDAKGKNEIIQGVTEYYDKQKEAAEANNNEINAIIEQAYKEERELHSSEAERINTLRRETEEQAIEILSQSQQEQLAVKEALLAKQSEINAEEAVEVAKHAREKRDTVVEEAEAEFEDQVMWAQNARDTLGILTDEQAEEVIQSAQKQREETVGQAEQSYDETLAIAKQQAGDHVDVVDWETLELKGRWRIFMDYMMDLFSGVKEIFQPFIDATKNIGRALYELYEVLVPLVSPAVAGFANVVGIAVLGVLELIAVVFNIVAAFVSWITGILETHQWLGQLIQVVAFLAGGLLGLYAVFQVVLVVIGALIKSIGIVVGVVKIFGTVIAILNSPLLGMVAVIGIVIAILVKLAMRFEWVQDIVAKVTEFISNAWNKFLGFFGKGTKEASEEAKEGITDVSDTGKSELGSLEEEGSASMNNLNDNTTDAFENINASATDSFGNTSEYGIESMENLNTGVTGSTDEMASSYSERMKEMGITSTESFGDMSADGINMTEQMSSGVSSETGAMASHVAGDVATMENSASGDFGKLTQNMSKNSQSIAKNVSSSFNGMTKNVNKEMSSLRTISSGALKGMAGDFSRNATLMIKTIQSSMQAIKTATEAGMRSVSGSFSKGFTLIIKTVQTSTQAMNRTHTQGLTSMNKSTSASMSSMNRAFSQGTSLNIRNVRAGNTAIVSAVRGLRSQLYSAGVDAMYGLNNGLVSRQHMVYRTARAIANNVARTMKSALKIKSPSRVMMSLGEYTGEGFLVGLLDMSKKIDEASQRMAESAIPEVDFAYDTPKGSFGTYSKAISGTVDVTNQQQVRLLKDISEQLEEKGEVTIVMDEREVGRIVEPVVTEQQDRQKRFKDEFRGGKR